MSSFRRRCWLLSEMNLGGSRDLTIFFGLRRGFGINPKPVAYLLVIFEIGKKSALNARQSGVANADFSGCCSDTLRAPFLNYSAPQVFQNFHTVNSSSGSYIRHWLTNDPLGVLHVNHVVPYSRITVNRF